MLVALVRTRMVMSLGACKQAPRREAEDEAGEWDGRATDCSDCELVGRKLKQKQGKRPLL